LIGGLEHLRIETSFFGINFLFIIRGKTRVTEKISMGVGVIIISESLTVKRRDLNSSCTLGSGG
jgi:hypothetical protein